MLFLAFAAFAQEAPPIVNGTATSDYPYVVTLWADDGNGYGYNFCSGTLIAPDYVVTAAHCVVAMDDNAASGYPELWIVVGYDIDTSAGWQDYKQASDWVANPNYDDQALTDDIGLVELSSSFRGVDYMPVNKDAISNRDVGDDYRAVGWGITADGRYDNTKKRTADIPLYEYDSNFLYFYDPDDRQGTCSGDSGGAAFELSGGTVYELSGVLSFGMDLDGDGQYCDDYYDGFTRVDAQLSWIERYTPVYSYDELYADTDTDTDSDTDADTDSDTDTDTDADADTDADTDTDAGTPDGNVDDDPVRPGDVGEDYASDSTLCAVEPGFAGWAGAALAGLLARRRRAGTRASG